MKDHLGYFAYVVVDASYNPLTDEYSNPNGLSRAIKKYNDLRIERGSKKKMYIEGIDGNGMHHLVLG